MEGHAAALLDDRWMVVVGGFGMRGVENEVTVLDTWQRHEEGAAASQGGSASADWWPLRHQGQRPYVRPSVEPCPGLQQPPTLYPSFPSHHITPHKKKTQPPVYGHAACAVGPRRLAVFGGCTMGGYAGETNELWFVDIDLRIDDAAAANHGGSEGVRRLCERFTSHVACVGGVATWRRVHALGQPLLRYGCSVPLTLPPQINLPPPTHPSTRQYQPLVLHAHAAAGAGRGGEAAARPRRDPHGLAHAGVAGDRHQGCGSPCC